MKYISFIGYGLLAISVITVGLFVGTGNYSTLQFPYADLSIQWMIIMICIAVAAAVLLPLVNIVNNPKGTIRSLIGLGVVGVVLLVCYLFADGDTPVVTVSQTYDSKAALITSDAGLMAMYITLSVSILGIIIGEVYSTIKKK